MTTVSTKGMSTGAMRARADQLNAGVREANRDLFERAREAAQLTWEAGLLDAAAEARAEADGAATRLPRLEAALAEAVTAERAAEDRARVQQAQLARREAAQVKARAELAPADRQEELAIRVHVCRQVVADYAAAAAAARRAREIAEAARDAWQAEVAELDAEAVAAERRAADPGTAPDAPGLAPGVARMSDMDDDTRNLLATVVLLTAGLPSGGNPPPGSLRRAGPDWRSDLADLDPRKFRQLRLAGNTVVIPPAAP